MGLGSARPPFLLDIAKEPRETSEAAVSVVRGVTRRRRPPGSPVGNMDLDPILLAVRDYCVTEYATLPDTLTVKLRDGRILQVPFPVRLLVFPMPQQKEKGK